jgi:hypothetical protein
MTEQNSAADQPVTMHVVLSGAPVQDPAVRIPTISRMFGITPKRTT